MATYAISENNANWTDIKATTLAGAKSAASRAQMFQGSDLWVGVREADGSVTVVAKKLHKDALDMNASGNWQTE